MKRDEFVPLKRVVEELVVSRITLWRAARSNIEGFPAPTIIRRSVFWRRDELQRLEEALMQYQGRVKFERRREAKQKVERLKKAAKAAPKRARSPAPAQPSQPNLFKRQS